jgi:peptide/nickel transport system ATP-binding protein
LGDREVHELKGSDRVIALDIRDLSIVYRTGRTTMSAVSGVDLDVVKGGTLGLVGESGSGKSSIARAVVGLIRPSGGEVVVHGQRVDRGRRSRQFLRRNVQMVFQDPNSSLNPRLTVRSTLAEAAAQLPDRERMTVDELIDLVALPTHLSDRFPHQLSGGQKQRVAIARALAVRPTILVADEITASLDVSVQASILNLLTDLQHRLGLSCLFISHNLAVVRYVASYVAVMHRGRIVEQGPTNQVLTTPDHDYTRELLAAIPGNRTGNRRSTP